MSTIELKLSRGRANAMVTALDLSEIDLGWGNVRVKSALQRAVTAPGKKPVTFKLPAERVQDLAEKLLDGIDNHAFDAGQTRGSAMRALTALCKVAGIEEDELRAAAVDDGDEPEGEQAESEQPESEQSEGEQSETE